MKKEENETLVQEKKELINTDPEFSKMMELMDRDFKNNFDKSAMGSSKKR